MKWDSINKELKGNIQSHNSVVDIDEVWSAIEPEVDIINAQKNRKNRLIFWLTMTGVFLIGLLVYSLLSREIPSTDSIATDEVLMSVTASKKEQSNMISNSPAITSTVLSDENQLTQNKLVKEEDVMDLLDSNDSETTKTVSVKPSKVSTNEVYKTVQANNSNTTFIASNEAEKVDEVQVSNVILDTKSTTNSNLTEVIYEPSPVKLLALPLNHLFNELPLPSSELPNVSYEFASMKNSKAADFGIGRKRTGPFGIHLIGGVSLARKQLSGSDSLALALLPIRRNSETSLETSHFGVMVDLQLASGWGFATGLERTQINERYNFETITKNIDFVPGIEFQIIDLNGDTMNIMGSIPQTTTTTETKEFYNSYTMYDVPLLVSFHQEANDFLFGLRAGVYINVAMSAKGRIATGMTTDINIEDADPELFKSSVGVSYYIGLSARKPLFDNVELSFSPFVRYYPKNFASAINPISQRYVLFGGNVGVGYRF